MLINILSNKIVYLSNTVLQTGSNNIPVIIKDPLKHHQYLIQINNQPFQEIKDGKINLGEFTNEEDHVIIKVRITQMGNVVEEFTSDKYPLRFVPVLGSVMTETFPISLEKIVKDNSNFQNNMLQQFEKTLNGLAETLKDFEERVLQIENEGEII